MLVSVISIYIMTYVAVKESVIVIVRPYNGTIFKRPYHIFYPACTGLQGRRFYGVPSQASPVGQVVMGLNCNRINKTYGQNAAFHLAVVCSCKLLQFEATYSAFELSKVDLVCTVLMLLVFIPGERGLLFFRFVMLCITSKKMTFGDELLSNLEGVTRKEIEE